jgi:NodT family efflux transporter outer membrane factor (OMF) lipoprotein
LLLLLSACTVGPDFKKPAAPEAKTYQSEPTKTQDANAQKLVTSMDIPGQWWTLFHSQPLDDLIAQSIKANADLAAAQAALRVAQENVRAQQGAYWPSVDANFNPTRQKTAGSLSPVPSNNAYIYSLHTAQLSISYVPDVFGLNRRTVESLEAQADAQRYQIEATYLTLTSNLVNAAINEASLRMQIEATQAIIDDQSKTLASFQKQFDLGNVAEADVAAQRASLAQAQATLPPLQKQLEQQRDAIKALAGKFPDADVTMFPALENFTLPNELPLSLPADLVNQRPDVLAAEAQLHSASAQIGIAVANRLPNFEIDAGIGSAADKIGQLFKAGTGFWSLAANVTQPIFEGGTLLHKQRAAEAAYDQAAAQYRSTVIGALQNVADTLHAIDADTRAWKAAIANEQAARRSLDIARAQLKLGDVNYLAMLSAEANWRQAKLALVQAQAARLADSVALFQALGGGWWNRAQDKNA